MPLSLKQLGPLRVLIGAEDVTQYVGDGFTFSSVDPGGFEAASFAFPRDLPQTIRGQPIRIDSGLKVAWEGRVGQIQRSLGHKTTVMGEGYGARLKDTKASMVFIDRDLTRWRQWSVQRQLNLASAGYNVSAFSTQIGADTATGKPGLIQQASGQLIGTTVYSESWYDAGPLNLIARIRVNSGKALGYTFPDANNLLEIYCCSDDVATLFDAHTNIAGAAPSDDFSVPTARRYGLIEHTYNVGGVAALNAGTTYGYQLSNLSVLGNHGLALRGAAPNDGFYPSDVLGWVIAQAAGLQAGTVQSTDASGYILPHSAYYTPVLLDQMVNDMAVAQGWHWGVWEAPSPLTGSALPRCDFRPRPAPGAFTAFLHREACENLDLREDLSQQFDTVTVNYTDVAGVPQAVSVSLDNPTLDQASLHRTVIFSAGTMTAATATIFAQEALVLTNVQARVTGSAEVIAPVDAPGPTPAWLLKPGIDRVRIGDLPSTDAFGSQSDVPISRMECSVGTSGMNTSLEFGSGGNLLETLQSRLSAGTLLAAQGGA